MLARIISRIRNTIRTQGAGDRSGRAAADVRKGDHGFGIRGKLFLSIGTLVAFTAMAIGVSLIVFRLAQSEFRNFNDVQLPSMVDAGALAIASTDITVASSKLINADTEESRAAALADLRGAVSRLVSTNRSALAREGAGQTVQTLNETASAFETRLDELDKLTKRRLELAAEKTADLGALFTAHEDIANLLIPRVEDSYSEAIAGGTKAMRDASLIVDSILNKDMATVRHLLTLRSEISSVVGATSAFVMTEDDAWANKFRENITNGMRLVLETVERLKSEEFEIAFENEISRLDRLVKEVVTKGSRGELVVGDVAWLDRLFVIQNAADNAAIAAIDQAISNLTLSGENAVAKNASTIRNLLDNQILAMRASQDSIAALHNLAAVLVQGALTDDISVIDPLQGRTTSMMDGLSDLTIIMRDTDFVAKVEQLARLSNAETGVMALRKEELETSAEAERIVGQVFDDIVRINGIVQQIVLQRQQAIAASSAGISASLATNGYVLLLLGLVMLAAAAFICVLVVHRGLMQPLTRLIVSIRQLADGDLEVSIGHTERRDEIGEMGRALDVFKNNARRVEELGREQEEIRQRAQQDRQLMMTELRESIGAVVDAAARGDFGRRVEATFNEPDLDAMCEGVNKLTSSVELGLSETSAVLSALAHGDLGKRVNGDYQGAFHGLKTDVNAMADKITAIAERIAVVTAAVRSATNEINSGVADLSTRTEHQASYLEETTASMEELSSTVHQNMQNGQDANKLASAAHEAAMEGGEVAGKAVVAMNNIEDSSRRITDIVGLIEEIAFQTNLLALNAAVEAARAGESGRGFAVVAAEVRALAQRAGAASRDIKTLILTSDNHVSAGVSLVGEAGQSLADIVESVKKVADFVAEIAASGEEQMTGIDQVSNAIVHMDSMTQQNAALVEETTASMYAALQQIDDLGEAIAFFKTRDTAAGPAEHEERLEAAG